jgi:hypothetical protein
MDPNVVHELLQVRPTTIDDPLTPFIGICEHVLLTNPKSLRSPTWTTAWTTTCSLRLRMMPPTT